MIVIENIHASVEQLNQVTDALKLIGIDNPTFEPLYVEHLNKKPEPFEMKFHVLIGHAPMIITHIHRNNKLFNAHAKGKLSENDIIAILVDAVFANKNYIINTWKDIQRLNQEMLDANHKK